MTKLLKKSCFGSQSVSRTLKMQRSKEIERFPKFPTHYFPGLYKYMMRGSTSFPNLFMAGDWMINRHGSWSQEKTHVTGLEVANRVVNYLEEGAFAKIIPSAN